MRNWRRFDGDFRMISVNSQTAAPKKTENRRLDILFKYQCVSYIRSYYVQVVCVNEFMLIFLKYWNFKNWKFENIFMLKKKIPYQDDPCSRHALNSKCSGDSPMHTMAQWRLFLHSLYAHVAITGVIYCIARIFGFITLIIISILYIYLFIHFHTHSINLCNVTVKLKMIISFLHEFYFSNTLVI